MPSEGANALPYSKLLDGTRARAAMTPALQSIVVRIRALQALGSTGALAIAPTAEQAERIAGLSGAADRPMKVFDDVRQARRWLEAQPPRLQ